jgi:hypothetical protein
MQCIVCHNNVISLEILALHTKLRKGFIAYHKSNNITAMKKHVELEHNTYLRSFVKNIMMWLILFHYLVNQPRSECMWLQMPYLFFFFMNQSKKYNET